MNDDLTLKIGWMFSNDLLWALNHPRSNESRRILKQFAEQLGMARLQLANDVASKLMEKVEK